jgi:sortase A
MTRPAHRAANRKRRWIANLLLAAGFVLVGVWAWSNLRGLIYQSVHNQEFDRSVRKRGPERPGKRPPALRNGEVIGRLIVPRLHLRAIVREGAGEDTLGVALGHIPGTALPGPTGNVGVAGHRDTLFRALREIRQDDLIEFETLHGNYSYRVRLMKVVNPKSVDVLQASQSPEITLVTCFPFHYLGPAPNRFIVQASLVSQEPPKQAAQQVPVAAAPRPAAPAPHPAPPAESGVSGGSRRVAFQVAERHSRELAPGISIGLSATDPQRRVVNGWMWVLQDRRTIWLRDQAANEPIVFYVYSDGKPRKLVITSVSANSMSGYLVLPGKSPASD